MATNRAPLRCSVCDTAVIVLGEQVIRGCTHEGATVIGEMEAELRAFGGLDTNGQQASDGDAA